MIKPAKLFDLGEVSIYDMGENISGYPVVSATVDGANIAVRCSEEINPDGTLNFDSCDRGQIQKDEYSNAKNKINIHFFIIKIYKKETSV